MFSIRNQFLLTIIRNLALKGVGIPASFGCLILLANSLGTTNFGRYSLVFSLVTMICAAFNRFYSVMLVRELTQAQQPTRSDLAAGVFSLSLAFTVIATLTVLVLSHFFLSENLVSAEVFTFLVLMTMLAVIAGSSLRGLGSVEIGLMVEQFFRPVFQLILISVLLIFASNSGSMSFNTAIATYAVSLGITCMLGFWIVARKWAKHFKLTKPEYKHSWFSKSGPALLTLGFIGGLNTQLPVLLMGVLSTTDELSIYRVAAGVAGLIGVVMLAINMATGPRLAKIALSGDMQNYESTLRFACTVAAALAIVLSIFFILFSDQLINLLFNEGYAKAASILWICCVAQALNCICGPVVLAFNMLGSESSNIIAIILAVIVGLISGALFMPLYGALGAAITALLAMTTWNLCLIVLLKVKYNIVCLPYSPRSLLKLKL